MNYVVEKVYHEGHKEGTRRTEFFSKNLLTAVVHIACSQLDLKNLYVNYCAYVVEKEYHEDT